MERKPRKNIWSKKAKLLSTMLALALLCTTVVPGSVFALDEINETETVVVETVDEETAGEVEESPVATYLEELATLLDDAKALDAEAEDLNDQCADIYDAAMAVYDEAYAQWEADTITDEEFAEVEEATEAVWQYLADEYGYDPYSISTYPQDELSASGTSDHIEIEITGSATFTIDGKSYTENVEITTSDIFTVSAYTLDASGNKVAYTNFTYSGNTTGDGSTQNDTVELSGSYPTGTYSSPVYYVVTLIKTVTFTLEDGSTMDVPVTLSVTTNYWDAGNNCPGAQRDATNWANGYYIGGSGIDVPVSGTAVGQAITEGKLAIKKVIYGDAEGQDTTTFTFVVQDSEGNYLVFEDNAYIETSDTLTDACKVTVNGGATLVLTDIPEGVYKITEIQRDGYIITDVDGNESTNYSVDYTVETKEDDEIPIATFTNKPLTTEAGISIAKTANGIASGSYPNPTVSIYAVGDDGSKTGDAVWSGTLIANGDRLYLNITLPAGTYVIEETGQTVDGYSCTTTISGGASVDGMKFTVEAGNRYDLTVNNAYTELPKVADITVTKSLAGNMYDTAKEFTFTAKYVNADRETVEETFTLKGGESITLKNLMIGSEVTITENDYSGEGYTTTVDGEAGRTTTITVADTNESIDFVNTKDVLIDTNVFLDNTPYILALGVVLAGGTAMIFRRRKLKAEH